MHDRRKERDPAFLGETFLDHIIAWSELKSALSDPPFGKPNVGLTNPDLEPICCKKRCKLAVDPDEGTAAS